MGQGQSVNDNNLPLKDELLERTNVTDKIEAKNLAKKDDKESTNTIGRYIIDYAGMLNDILNKKKDEKDTSGLNNDISNKLFNVNEEAINSDDESEEENNIREHNQKTFKIYDDRIVQKKNIDFSNSDTDVLTAPKLYPILIVGKPEVDTILKVKDLSKYSSVFPVSKYIWSIGSSQFELISFPNKISDSFELRVDRRYIGYYIRVVGYRTIVLNVNPDHSNIFYGNKINIFDLQEELKINKTVKSQFVIGPVTIQPELYNELYNDSKSYYIENVLLFDISKLIELIKLNQNISLDSCNTDECKIITAAMQLTEDNLIIISEEVDRLVNISGKYNWIVQFLFNNEISIPTNSMRLIYIFDDYVCITIDTTDKNTRYPIIAKMNFDQWVLFNLFQGYTIFGDISIDQLLIKWIEHVNKPLLIPNMLTSF